MIVREQVSGISDLKGTISDLNRNKRLSGKRSNNSKDMYQL